MTNNEEASSTEKFAEIASKDLQLLLQPKLGKQVIVLKTSTSLLPPGDNYACSILKIYAIIKRDESKPEEELNLVAKMFPSSQTIRDTFDFSLLFKKEIFFYEKLLPSFRKLEIDFGAKDNETFNIEPKILGLRYSSNNDVHNIDDSVVILMENLKTKGYYMLNKIEGLDLEHSRLAIKSLARLHALGIACKHHYPEFFKNEVLINAITVPFKEIDGKKDIFVEMFKMMCKEPRIAKHREKFAKLLGPEMKQLIVAYVPEEPWLSIVHLDFWTNNILYHKDQEGNLDDIKFIDYQSYAYGSPMRDLPYFLCASTNVEVMTHHFDELLDLYYDTFISVLKKMRCEIEPFGRASFDKQLKIDACFEFFHCILAVKFFTAEIDKNTFDMNNIGSVVIFSQINEIGYDKWYRVLLTYIRKGWI